jgi:DNA polymerase III alpha subunit
MQGAVGAYEFKPGDRVELTETPTISGVVARVHSNPKKAGHDIVVVKVQDEKGKFDLFVQADALNLASRFRKHLVAPGRANTSKAR